jgi:hypothetical protein
MKRAPTSQSNAQQKAKDPAAQPHAEGSSKALDARVAKIAGVSFETIRSAACEALKEMFPPDDTPGCYMGPWVEDVYDDKLVFQNDGQLFSIGYAFNAGKVTLSGNPTQVIRTYTPVGGGAADVNTGTAAAPPESAKAARYTLAASFRDLSKRVDATLTALGKRATARKAKPLAISAPVKSPFKKPNDDEKTTAGNVNDQKAE